MKTNHIALGRKLAHTLKNNLALSVAAEDAYSIEDGLAQCLLECQGNLLKLRTDLSKIFLEEVKGTAFEGKGNPYDPENSGFLSEANIGIKLYRPKKREKMRRFTKREKTQARRVIIEIIEDLAYVGGLISSYDLGHPARLSLVSARAQCHDAGSYLGLWPMDFSDVE